MNNLFKTIKIFENDHMTFLQTDTFPMTVAGFFKIKENTGFFWFWWWQFDLNGCASGFRY
jgi:hypothetical protein